MLKALAKTVTQDSVASAVMYYAWLNGFHNQVMELVIKDEVKETRKCHPNLMSFVSHI